MAEASGVEEGNQEWAKGRDLAAAKKFEGAEAALLEAERFFMDAGHRKEAYEVLLDLSKVHMGEGRAPQTLEDLERAQKLDEGGEDPRLIFYMGLANLVMGREDNAHHFLTRYIELAEEGGDIPAQLTGHFYLALTYERHGEPCMATAELEVAREITGPERSLSYIRKVAFLAHLWLKREQYDEAEALEAEALKILGEQPKARCGSEQGLVLLVKAEVDATRSRWDESRETFELSRKCIGESRLAKYFEALALAWYGETLLTLKRSDESVELLTGARSMFEGLSNEAQAGKVSRLITGGASQSAPGA